MRFTSKIGLAIAVAAVAALTIAPMAMAGVVSSNHDMISKMGYGSTQSKSGVCSFCHIPHKAGGAKLWSSSYTNAPSGTWASSTISLLCYSCHGATTYTGANEVNPFGVTNKHGRTVTTLTGGGLGGNGDIAGLPGDVPGETGLGSGDLKCTSCHDVHDNSNRPFIRWSTAAANVYGFRGVCEKCHVRRANSGGAKKTTNAVSGYAQHPTDQSIATVANIAFQGTIATELSISPGANAPGTISWNLGGHRDDGSTTGNMTCATCHAVHGNETSVFSAADGSSTVSAETTGYNALTVMSGQPLAASPYMEPICVGCHMNDATAGPGTAGTRSHPIGTLRSTWTVTGVPASLPTPLVWGGAADNAIVCRSCHDMHYANPNTSLLGGSIDVIGGVTYPNKNCNTCHLNSTMPNHHPANKVYSGIGGTTAIPYISTAAAAWTGNFARTVGTVQYPLGTGGLMTCGTCHGGSGATAHNNTSSVFPALIGFNSSSEMCIDCHTANPSLYTSVASNGPGSATLPNGSHFVGSIATAAYARTAVWPGSGLSSKYYPDFATRTALICESCHSLKLNTGTPMSSSNGTAVANVMRSSVGLLLTASGNQINVYNTNNTGTNQDLCTGCHGAAPTGGNAGAGSATHPTISTGMTAVTTGISNKIVPTNGTVSLNSAGLVNCESCHRPHDAASGSGALILEGAGSVSTKLATTTVFDRATGNLPAGTGNYTEEATFCNMCHSY